MRLFRVRLGCNEDLAHWDVSGVTDMTGLFFSWGDGTPAFNADISGWDTSRVTDMRYTFAYASSFNADISAW